MAEMWDIAKYVEEHPDDYEQRWKLAKKLYAAWEYRLALEHLQVLKNEWDKKVNVVRYLAASYYRLGRYDEAISELQSSVETWPDETGLREQMARVLEIAGRREEAAEVWKTINEGDPHHPIAANAVKRLVEKREPSQKQDLSLADSDSGIDLNPGRVCPGCGAQNSYEYARCWQCQAQLAEVHATPRPTPHLEERHLPILSPETLMMGLGLAAVAMLALCLYLSMKLVFLGNADPDLAISTLGDFYRHEISLSRVLTGLVIIIAWPLVLTFALRLVKPERPIPNPLIWLVGLLQASLAFLCSWLPFDLIPLALLLPAVVGFVAVAVAFGLGFLRSLNVWVLQFLLMCLTTLIAFSAIESIQLRHALNPIKEIPAVLRYARAQAANAPRGAVPLPGNIVPVKQKVVWQSTGSVWLDLRAGNTRFTVYSENESVDLKFEINQGETKTCAYEFFKGRKWLYKYPIRVGEEYFVKIMGADGTNVKVEIAGMLIPKVLE